MPRERDDPVAGLARAVDARPNPALAKHGCVKVLHPVGDGRDWRGNVRPRDGGTQPNDGVPARRTLAVPRPPPAERNLDANSRFEPVDVRAIEEANFDQAHGADYIGGSASGNSNLPMVRTTLP